MSGANTAKTVMAMIALIVSALAMQTASCMDWDSYKPSYSQGSGNDDWWIKYPDQSTFVDTPVEHPSWVLEALKEKPVLILDHSTDCKSCPVQKSSLEKALDSLDKEIAYFNFLADGSEEKAFEVFKAYGPIGEQYYVPTTVFITLIKGPDDKVSVAWHSEEDVMSEEEIDAYLKDAIYYYRTNAPQRKQ